jgi:hypothetical protein
LLIPAEIRRDQEVTGLGSRDQISAKIRNPEKTEAGGAMATLRAEGNFTLLESKLIFDYGIPYCQHA